MSTRHSELRLQGTLEPAFLPLNWKIQTGIHIKPIPADLLLLAPGLAVERDGAGLSPHIVGIFDAHCLLPVSYAGRLKSNLKSFFYVNLMFI